MSQPAKKPVYRVDTAPVSRAEAQGTELYPLEKGIQEAVMDAAKALQLIRNLLESELYTVALPSELYTLFDLFDPKASEAVAIAFLNSRGFCVCDHECEQESCEHNKHGRCTNFGLTVRAELKDCPKLAGYQAGCGQK